ncbi:MAG: MmcQ/YjbR family DNA-binding protein [Clostridia bacterium]|nr:MmcQ/YjbR family DNA-binding protein [Clostridia bacterium]
MDRYLLEDYISHFYKAEPEHLWMRYPSYAVFRHAENSKWFAVVMTVSSACLGIKSGGAVDIVNLKCGRENYELLCQKAGIYPAYHMCKGQWISVALDGTVAESELKELLALSHRLTKGGERDGGKA